MTKKIDNSKVNPVVESEGDKAHRVARVALSLIPGVGGAAAELFNALITPPLEKRKAEWMTKVTEAINELYEKTQIDIEGLQNNEQFFTTLVHATHVALRNHQNEKIEALKNAILNSALPDAPDDSLQQIFLNLVDSFTVWHLAILKLFQNPEKWADDNNHQFSNLMAGGLSSILESAFPQLQGQRSFYDIVWRDLYLSGLVNTESLHGMITGRGLMEKRTTEMGDKFLKFISEPIY